MPRLVRVFDAFVSSPGDVGDERSILQRVVAEINAEYLRRHRMLLNPILWETSTLSAIGSDVQDVINRQVGDQYDLYVGILWSRFGTPTPRAGSGTAEEFTRALSRYRAGEAGLSFMFFVRESELPHDVDPDQLKRVRAFTSSLPQEGVLYRTYKKPEEFEREIGRHLRSYLDDRCAEIAAEPGDTGTVMDREGDVFGALGRVVAEIGDRLGHHVRELVEAGRHERTEKDTRAILTQIDACVRSFEKHVRSSEPRIEQEQNALAGQVVFRGEAARPIVAERADALRDRADKTRNVLAKWSAVLKGAPDLGSSFRLLSRRLTDAADHMVDVIGDFIANMAKLDPPSRPSAPRANQ